MSTSEAPLGRRRRDTVLEALERFRRLGSPRAFVSFILFLYVCENEGLTVTELSRVAGATLATTARIVRILSGNEPLEKIPDDCLLFELRLSHNDRRVSFIHLTAQGVDLRNEIDCLIRAATLIAPDPKRLASSSRS
jgi:DNA-binding MarR family transcriptional regulator